MKYSLKSGYVYQVSYTIEIYNTKQWVITQIAMDAIVSQCKTESLSTYKTRKAIESSVYHQLQTLYGDHAWRINNLRIRKVKGTLKAYQLFKKGA